MNDRLDTAAIVVVGDEILSGKYVEENAAYLIPALRELGVALRRVEVVPDVIDDIADAVGRAAERCQHVFTSGGVGPTHDDLTIAGIARAFGVGVVRHPQLEHLVAAFYGTTEVGRNLRMAEVPDGAELLASDHPSWPVVQFRNVTILPGVPAIFRKKFASIRERFRARPFHVRRVYCLGDEGALAPALDAVVAAHPEVGVGSYPRIEAADFRVVVTLESRDEAAAGRALGDLVGKLPAGVVVRTE